MESNICIAIIGIGVVGRELAYSFGEKFQTIAFDIDKSKIHQLESFPHPPKLSFSHKIEDLKKSNIYILALPTLLTQDQKPNLEVLKTASIEVARLLKRGDIVIYESTTYPTCTRKVCIPLLEKESKLKLNKDFHVGYSPERINPGDNHHTLKNITKLIAASNKKALHKINWLYKQILDSTHLVSSIEIAEASKLLENAQRDLNIAFMNEAALILEKVGLDIQEVLQAAKSKWNFLPFTPGLAGGPCIDVSTQYLIHIAQTHQYDTKILSATRSINDSMPNFIAQKFIKLLLRHKINPLSCNLAMLGISFKENYEGFIKSKALEVLYQLKEFGCKFSLYDPRVDPKAMARAYSLKIHKPKDLRGKFDAFLITVGHDEFKNLPYEKYLKDGGFILDIKGILKDKKLRHAVY